jgi:hypothetical protein
MTSTHVLIPTTRVERPARPSGTRALLRRLPAAVLGLGGAGVLGYGVTQPWVTTFAGLIKQSGWDTHNGNLLFAGAIASGVLAVASAVWANAVVRWLLALVGFASAAFGGYLLIQLYTVTQTSDSMILLGKGPGLYIATAGAAVVFSTIFLPMPASPDPIFADALVTDPDGFASSSTADEPGRAGAWVLTALTSRLRYPAALLAVVAGLAHVPVTPDHLNEAKYIGILFLALTIVCVVLAALLLVWDSPIVWAALGGACLLAVLAFVLSRTVGLPLISDDIGNWTERLGVVSVLTETGVAILAAAALVKGRRLVHG